MDDYILESDHYGYYSKGADFAITVEKEDEMNIPEYLKMYAFDADDTSKFPTSKKGTTGLSGDFRKVILAK